VTSPYDPWSDLRGLTPARIALGRTGASLPTREVLSFALAHAQARDAVHAPFDLSGVAARAGALGFPTCAVSSGAPDRSIYLRRPDLGRRLSEESRAALTGWQPPPPGDLVIVVADGLSASAVHARATPLLEALAAYPLFSGVPVVVATQARVALGDEVAAALGRRCVLVLIGERPGLSSPDSLGAYLTFEPRIGSTDAERNCVSNIRPEGLSDSAAAARIHWLTAEAYRRGLSGVALKDESDLTLLHGKSPRTHAIEAK
jgi:ethanolamine ammonia-lyase small subunit